MISELQENKNILILERHLSNNTFFVTYESCSEDEKDGTWSEDNAQNEYFNIEK